MVLLLPPPGFVPCQPDKVPCECEVSVGKLPSPVPVQPSLPQNVPVVSSASFPVLRCVHISRGLDWPSSAPCAFPSVFGRSIVHPSSFFRTLSSCFSSPSSTHPTLSSRPQPTVWVNRTRTVRLLTVAASAQLDRNTGPRPPYCTLPSDP